ncbi:MAG: dihydrofolate reductase [Hyphomicrobiales bacterium]|nr:dihydrofolate reductase [Alphaproteobacteria bacterium]
MTDAPPRRFSIVLLAAIADNGVIGRDNGLPFRQRSDLQRFKSLTMGKPVLMGRKTYLSIGKPLPGRTNIVVSRDAGFAPAGVVIARSLDAALAAARDDADKRGAGEIVVIGGTDIFAQTMPLADRMEITHVHASPAGDTYFPPIDATQWRAATRSDHPPGPQDEAAFSYVTYERV